MRKEYTAFKGKNAEVVAVAQGTAQDIAKFCKDFAVPFPMLADTKREAYKAYALSKGNFMQIMGPQLLGRALSALRSGASFGRPIGDPKQLQGTFVIEKGGFIRFAHRGKDSSDNPSNAQIISVLEKL